MFLLLICYIFPMIRTVLLGNSLNTGPLLLQRGTVTTPTDTSMETKQQCVSYCCQQFVKGRLLFEHDSAPVHKDKSLNKLVFQFGVEELEGLP